MIFQAVGEIEQVYFENTSRHTMASTVYNVHLYPSVYLKNFLPIDIVIVLPGHTEEKLLKASTILQLPTIDPIQSSIVIKVIVKNYFSHQVNSQPWQKCGIQFLS